MISAKVLADHLSPQEIRILSFQVTCHRFILPEVNTHRVFSRNWRSSRAVPVKKLIDEVRMNPAMPVHWGLNQKGMQAQVELSYPAKEEAMAHWWDAAQEAVKAATWLDQVGTHKQIVNRVLEPYLWVHGVITSTDWTNFFALRRHPDAQPEIKALADAMWQAMQGSVPKHLKPGAWHVPYYYHGTWESYFGEDEYATDIFGHTLQDALKISTASCARVSYFTHDGRKPTNEENIELCNRLLGSQPLHASPAEHQATPDEQYIMGQWHRPNQHGNFRGWIQHRKTLEGEFIPG